MTTKTTLALICTLVFVWRSPALPAGPDQFGSTVTVSVYDRAHIQPKTLEQAERLATAMFAMAGIPLHWRTHPVSDETVLVEDLTVHTGDECKPLDPTVVQMVIVSHAPNGVAPQTLGYSLPCARSGLQVVVYADRVEAVSNQTPAVFYRVLGYTLTHELGHVLLRSLAHEESGLMKAIWSKRDWQRAAVSNIPFTPDQANRIVERLHRIESPPCCTAKASDLLTKPYPIAMQWPALHQK